MALLQGTYKKTEVRRYLWVFYRVFQRCVKIIHIYCKRNSSTILGMRLIFFIHYPSLQQVKGTTVGMFVLSKAYRSCPAVPMLTYVRDPQEKNPECGNH